MTENNQQTEDILDIIEKYAKEYGADAYIDEFRLRELELKIPGIKGKWASYKAVNRAKLFKLKRERDKLLDEGVDIIKSKRESQGNPISNKGAEFILKKSTQYREVNDKIEKLTILCDYFDDCLKNIQSIGFDIKNLIDTTKIEEM
jgi:hypothetical protein